MVFNRLLGNDWSILDDFSAHPHEIWILIKWWKNQPSSTSESACTQNLHYAHSGFWPILAYFSQKVLQFLRWEIFPIDGKLIRDHLSQKLTLAHPYHPIFLTKTVLFRVKKSTFIGFFSKGRLNLWAKYSEPKKLPKFFSSWSYKSLKFEFVCSRISPSKFWSGLFGVLKVLKMN